MLKNTLNSISPLDGRYATKLEDLEQYFSEFALIKNRVLVEINWLIFMSQTKSLSFVPILSKNKETSLLKIIDEFSLKDAEQIKKINWLVETIPNLKNITAKIRYRQKEQTCSLKETANGWRVEFDVPQRAITPGQSAVFYSDDICLGGGEIE